MKQATSEVTPRLSPALHDAFLASSDAERARLIELLEDEDAITLTYAQVRRLRAALTVGLAALAEIDRQLTSHNPGPVLSVADSPSSLSEYAEALHYLIYI